MKDTVHGVLAARILEWLAIWIVVIEKTLKSPLDSGEIKPVNPKGNQSWILIGRTDTETEAPILWLPNVKNQLVVKDPDAGKDWGQEENRETEDEKFGWYHRLSGHEFEQTPGDIERQGAWCVVIHGISKSWTWLNNNSQF